MNKLQISEHQSPIRCLLKLEKLTYSLEIAMYIFDINSIQN